MWLPSWLRRFGAGGHHVRREAVRARSQRGRPAFLLSVERLEDRLALSAGALDLTFGAGGKVITDFATTSGTGAATSDAANALALQADGKIVVVGSTDFGGGGKNFAVARYLADGTPDPSFTPDGIVATDFFGGNDEARSVAIQADGKIVVVGTATVAGSIHFALARYNSDGNLDRSFGDNGKVTDLAIHFGSALGLQADGKILVAGDAIVDGSVDFALARYNSDGNLDRSFGNHGTVTTDFAGGGDVARSLIIQEDGKIVVAGDTATPGGFNFALARYDPNGSPDFDFDADGKLTTDFDGNDDEVPSVALQADGKIVVAGRTSRSQVGGQVGSFALARYNSNGSPDSDFDADGKVTTDFGSGFNVARSVVIQAAGGRIVAAGSASVGGFSTFALARYNTDGSPDISFGSGGKVTTDFTSSVSSFANATSVALQADGKIVAAGSAGQDFTLARYEGVAPAIAVVFGGADLRSGSTVAFGSTLQGTPLSRTFVIRNVGNLSLTVSSFAVPAGFQLTTATSFPIRLAAGALTSMSVQLTAGAAGIISGKVSIGSNDSNENPFLIGVTGTVLAPAHEIQVLTGTTDIPDNTGVVNFGTATLFGLALTRTFTVRNIGNSNLTLGPSISVPFGFIVASGFGSTTLGPGASTTFTVGLNTNILGTFKGQVSFATNDGDENPFNFTVTGAVSSTSSAPMIRGESLTRRVDEGGVATLRGHLVDPDALDELFLRVDWGDGTPLETHAVGRAPFALQHRYLDDAPSGTAADEHLVHFTWFDSGGGSNSKTLPVTVGNVAPRVSAGLPVLLGAGETFSRVGSFSDPGLDSWFATVDYGEGGGPQWLPLGPDGSFILSHRYTQPGVYHVRVRIFDDDGGGGTANLTVRGLPDDRLGLANVAPRLFLGRTQVVRVVKAAASDDLGQAQDLAFAGLIDVLDLDKANEWRKKLLEHK